MRNKNQTGFTLIELLVVIAIIGLLASVVLLALNSARSKSRDAKRIADIRQIASAMELYFNDNSTYPSGVSGALYNHATLKTDLSPKYIGIMPQAPAPQDGNCLSTPAAGSNEYYFTSAVGQGAGYTISFCLGGVTGGYSPGPHTLTPSGVQ